MSIPFEQASIVIFDTETTGLDPAGGDRIVEIACMRLWGGETVAVFETLLNPQRAVSPGAFAVNHISAQMLADAPTFDVVSRQLLDFMRGSYVCSYNATFDMGFLAQELWRMGESVPADMMVMDILKMARRLLPGMARYSLWFVAQQLGVAQEQSHRALADVEMTRAVLMRLAAIAQQKGISSIDEYVRLFGVGTRSAAVAVPQITAQIQEAISCGAALKIRYASAQNGQVGERVIVPKVLQRAHGTQCVVAHCRLRGAERTFRVDGILHLEIIQNVD